MESVNFLCNQLLTFMEVVVSTDSEDKGTLQAGACVLAKVPEKSNEVTLDFPLWNLSPPPFTVPVVKAKLIQASGLPTPVRSELEGRQLPLSQDTTANEVHDILFKADTTGRYVS